MSALSDLAGERNIAESLAQQNLRGDNGGFTASTQAVKGVGYALLALLKQLQYDAMVRDL